MAHLKKSANGHLLKSADGHLVNDCAGAVYYVLTLCGSATTQKASNDFSGNIGKVYLLSDGECWTVSSSTNDSTGAVAVTVSSGPHVDCDTCNAAPCTCDGTSRPEEYSVSYRLRITDFAGNPIYNNVRSQTLARDNSSCQWNRDPLDWLDNGVVQYIDHKDSTHGTHPCEWELEFELTVFSALVYVYKDTGQTPEGDYPDGYTEDAGEDRKVYIEDITVALPP